MRISIWQAFSSNHSSNFTAVGQFETPEKAIEASYIIERMLKTILAAQEARSSHSNTFPHYQNSPTLVEQQFSWELGIEWNAITLDWAFQADWAVRQLDNWVIVDNVIDQTHNGIKPVDSLLKILGGVPMFAEEMAASHIAVKVTATAPALEITDTIYNELSAFFSTVKEYGGGDLSLFESEPPWSAWSEKIKFYPWQHDASRLFWGVISRKDTQLELRDLNFTELGYGLPALIAYLRAKGCTSIEYDFAVVTDI